VVALRVGAVADRCALDSPDLRRVPRERALDADAEPLLPHRERLARACALALDHDALEDLDAAPLALDHLEVDANRVPRLELRNAGAQLSAFEFLDDLAHTKRRPTGRLRMVATLAPRAPFVRTCCA